MPPCRSKGESPSRLDTATWTGDCPSMALKKCAAKKSKSNGHRTEIPRAEPDDPAFLTTLPTTCFVGDHCLVAAACTDGELGRGV